jgi:dolichol-phosphate mannosyltransferase
MFDDAPSRREPPEVSVVIPVYRCAECIEALYVRLKATLSAFASSEIVFIDDRSPDRSWEILQRLAREDPSVRAYRLSRNFGQHAAITAGLAQSTGRFTVVMDCDLQEPPEVIAQLHDKALEGYEIVHTRRSRRHQPRLRRLAGRRTSACATSCSNRDRDRPRNAEHAVAQGRRRVPEPARQGPRYLAVLDWLGYSQRDWSSSLRGPPPRTSSYTMRKLMRLADDGCSSHDDVPAAADRPARFLVAFAGGLLAAY